MKPTKHLAVIAIVLGLAGPARAELKWEKKSVELHPAVADETAVAHFKYENVGTKPVHIINAQTSCGCTVATLKSNDVAPGDKGEITATLNIGDRVGTQHKSVTVTTDDPSTPTTVLMLTAVIPQLLDIQPVFVFWNLTEPLDPKVITVKPGEGSAVKNISVISSSPQITATVKPGASQKEWTITLTPPKDAKTEIVSDIVVTPEYASQTPKSYHVGARVLRRTP